MGEEQLIEELKKLGWHYCHLYGHGTEETVFENIDGKMLQIGDIEKSNILVPPDCIFKREDWSEDY